MTTASSDIKNILLGQIGSLESENRDGSVTPKRIARIFALAQEAHEKDIESMSARIDDAISSIPSVSLPAPASTQQIDEILKISGLA